jgi:peptidoglycan/LPS O-acetylase OafA/YrhL
MKAYRPDIDALRALSVSLVVIFHAFPLHLTGGFIGVDVFFVISGFLITKNIQGSIQDNTFSFLTFYQNRARRLLPVLYLVITVSAIIGIFYLTPKSYHAFAESGALSLVYLGNTYFARKTDYFGDDHADHPLLHLWSLSVEEQFYFLWPLMLLVLIRYAPKLILHLVIFASIFASIAFAELHANTQNGTYFLLQYRAGELLLGAWFALSGLKANKNNLTTNTLLMAFALCLIIASSFMLDKASTFPGINVLWPCLGAVLYLYSAQHLNNKVYQFITMKPVIMIGLLSYSIYLWHWPLLIYGKASGVLTGPVSYLLYFAILLLISYLSWRYVEQAFRTKDYTSASTFFIKRLLPITLSLAALVSLPFETGTQKILWLTLWGEDSAKYYQQAADRKQIVAKPCIERPNTPAYLIRATSEEECKFGNLTINSQLLLIGDSHAEHFIRFFDHIAKNENKSGKAITRAACLPLIDTPVYNKGKLDKECLAKTKYWYENHLKSNPQYVFLAAYWSGYLNNDPDNKFPSPPRTITIGEQKISDREVFYRGLKKSIEKIISVGAVPVLVEQVPEFNYPIEKCIFKKTMSLSSPKECSISEKMILFKHKEYLAIFDKIQQEYPSVLRLNVNSLLCSNGSCSPFIDNDFIYYNDDHLNFSGARKLAIEFQKQKPSIQIADW